jgi:hypothetical protein
MTQTSRPGKNASKLSPSTNARLGSYALAASAAGVSLLALAQPSAAEIIYTPANGKVGRDGGYNIDLNHDGIVDFRIVEMANSRSAQSYNVLSAKAAKGNRLWCFNGSCSSAYPFFGAARLASGNEIGQAQVGWTSPRAEMGRAIVFPRGTYSYAYPWGYQGGSRGNYYLGLSLKIDGENHYGWARVSVTFHRSSNPDERSWEAHVTGYAYETIANKSILAGQTQESDPDAAVPKPSSLPTHTAPGNLQFGTLGMLAAGRP